MNQWSGVVEITGTTFKRFSNCGSIIRNHKEFSSSTLINFGNSFVEVSTTNELLPSQDIVERPFGKVENIYEQKGWNAATPFATSTCTTDPGSSTEKCYSITIQSSIFEEFGFLKDTTTYDPPIVDPDLGMRYYGLVLSLEGF
mmetsp:Transcript_8833/g.8192  ORF Transcript_8833/g.8192 Transcript_8833/m.8192 type:complete len:143 (-) Transcript_8833:94-522(-)